MTSTIDTRVRYQRIVQTLLLSAALALVWFQTRHMFVWVGFMFGEPSEDLSHGWFVPLFSLYLLWQRRRELLQALDGPSLRGLCVTCGWLLLLWLGERGSQLRITQVAVYGLLGALPYAIFGRRLARVLAFPVLFLGFTVPLGFLDFFTVRLRLLTAMLTSALLNAIGIPVIRAGTGLHSLAGSGFALDIADPCSGLRSIFALAALTAGYASLMLRGAWRQWLLFACAIPLAVLGNMVRIITIAIVARLFGQKVGTGFYHDYSGYITFIVGTLLMMQVAAWLARIGRNSSAAEANDAPSAARDAPAPSRSFGPAGWLTLLLLTTILLGTIITLRTLPPPYLEPQEFLAPQLTELPGYRLTRPWFCQNEQCRQSFDELEPAADGAPPPCPACGAPLSTISLGEKTVLPADTLLMKGNYYDLFGRLYRVTVVINGAERRSIHRPELCLPAQGFTIDETLQTHLVLNGGSELPMALVALRRIGAARATLPTGQAYFFVSAHRTTASHLVRVLISIRDRALFNRVTRWAMIVVTGDPAFNTPSRRLDLQEFMQQLYPSLRQHDVQSDSPHIEP